MFPLLIRYNHSITFYVLTIIKYLNNVNQYPFNPFNPFLCFYCLRPSSYACTFISKKVILILKFAL